MAGNKKISAIIIAKNEEIKIRDCLKSLDWVDEIIVCIDPPILDKTPQIAKEFGAKVFEYESKDFADRRNYATKRASGAWILYVDADERVSPALKEEIQTLINSKKTDYNGYAISRKNIILGKELKRGGQYPDYVKRLFRKEYFKSWTGELHEEPNYLQDGEITVGNGKTIGYLTNSLIHIKHDRLSEMVEKTNKWSEVEAKLMYDAGHPPMNVPRFLSAIWREFFLRMIKQRAFLDGSIGIIYALYQVFSRFISYAKLWEMQINKK